MRWRSLTLSASLLLTAGCPNTPAPQPPPPPPSQPARASKPPIEQRFADLPSRAFDDPHRAQRVLSTMAEIDALLRDAQAAPGKGHPALAAGIVVDDALIWSRGYGQRSAAGGAVDASTVFRIGSITKTFTGMAALRLRDSGKLDLDRPAHDYLRPLGGLRYPSRDNPPITVRQLLTHTSGMARTPPVFLADGEHMTRDKLLSGFDGFLLQTPSLDVVRYSNIGVGTVGLVVEAIAGKPYRQVIDETILSPLGMKASRWEAAAVAADDLAAGHGRDDQPLKNDEHLVIGPSEGSGGLYSSVEDMARFIALHLAAWPPRSDPEPHAAILRRSSLRESHTMARFGGMSADFTEEGGPKASANGVGIAWQVQQRCELEHLVWHNGATAGYAAALLMAPRRGVGIVLLASDTRSVTGLAKKALLHIIAEAQLLPRKPRPSPVLKQALDGPIARSFSSGTLSASDYDTSFSAAFRAAVPHEGMTTLHRKIFAGSGACRFSRYLDLPSPTDAWVELSCDRGEPYALWIRFDFASPQRIAGYLIRPLSAHHPDPPEPRCKRPKIPATVAPPEKPSPDS